MTDDRGVYRIYGVPAGKYFVAVGKTDAQMFMVPTDLGRDYPLTYYPGTTNEAEAKEVSVAGAGEAAGVNIAVGSRGFTFAVSGRVVVPEHGAPAASYWIVYGKYTEGQQNFVPTNFGGAVSADGKFRFEGVGPGDYGVVIAAQPGTPGAGYSDVTPVRVSDADVGDVEITVRSGATVTGVVSMEDLPDPAMRDSLTKFQIIATVSSMGDQGAAPIPAQAEIGRDGVFTLSGLRPGAVKLWLNDFNAPKGFSILRIEREGVPIANGFDVGADESISGLRVVLGYGTGVVRGQVVFKNGSVPKKHELFAVASRVGGADNPRPFRVDERGQFVIEGLAPGDYKVSLILLPDPVVKVFGFEPDPGQTVSVANGGAASVTLTVDFDAVQIVEKPRW
jgi:hypothetical protein